MLFYAFWDLQFHTLECPDLPPGVCDVIDLAEAEGELQLWKHRRGGFPFASAGTHPYPSREGSSAGPECPALQKSKLSIRKNTGENKPTLGFMEHRNGVDPLLGGVGVGFW